VWLGLRPRASLRLRELCERVAKFRVCRLALCVGGGSTAGSVRAKCVCRRPGSMSCSSGWLSAQTLTSFICFRHRGELRSIWRRGRYHWGCTLCPCCWPPGDERSSGPERRSVEPAGRRQASAMMARRPAATSNTTTNNATGQTTFGHHGRVHSWGSPQCFAPARTLSRKSEGERRGSGGRSSSNSDSRRGSRRRRRSRSSTLRRRGSDLGVHRSHSSILVLGKCAR
jgi:hypothetical protein